MLNQWRRIVIATLLLLAIVYWPNIQEAEAILSQQATTLPDNVHSIQLELGYPLPLIWAVKYNYGLTDWLDIGANGSFMTAEGYLGTIGAQGKIRLFSHGSAAMAFALLADYFNSDEGEGLLTHPALELTWNLGEDKYLIQAFVGSYVFLGDMGFSCFTLCGDASSPNKSDVYIDPGLGFNIMLAKHWDLFLKGYALINAENGRAEGGGILGVAFNW